MSRTQPVCAAVSCTAGLLPGGVEGCLLQRPTRPGMACECECFVGLVKRAACMTHTCRRGTGCCWRLLLTACQHARAHTKSSACFTLFLCISYLVTHMHTPTHCAELESCTGEHVCAARLQEQLGPARDCCGTKGAVVVVVVGRAALLCRPSRPGGGIGGLGTG